MGTARGSVVRACALAICSVWLHRCSGVIDSGTEDPYSRLTADLFVSKDLAWRQHDIPVCWELEPAATSLDPTLELQRGWVRDAVARTWQANADLRFTGWGPCTAGSTGIRIAVKDSRSFAALGTYIDGRPGGMELNLTFKSYQMPVVDNLEMSIKATAVHEFGHALGFAHEQLRADSPAWCLDTVERPPDTSGTLALGPWDEQSVMNYCNPRFANWGRLSAIDIAGVRLVYGLGPTCGSLGGTICQQRGLSTACHGQGPTTSDCDYCCGGALPAPSCAGLGTYCDGLRNLVDCRSGTFSEMSCGADSWCANTGATSAECVAADSLYCPSPASKEVAGQCVPSCGEAGGNTCAAKGSHACDGHALLGSYDCPVCCYTLATPLPEGCNGGTYDYCNGSTLVQCTPTSVTKTSCANGCLNNACVNYATDCVNYDPDPAVPKTACVSSTRLVDCTKPNAPKYTDCAAAGQVCGAMYGSPWCVPPAPPPPPAGCNGSTYNYCNGSTLVQCTPSSVATTVCANGCLNNACVNYAADCVNYDPDPAVPKTACVSATRLVNCTNPNAPTYTDCAAAGQTCGTSYGSPACVAPPPPAGCNGGTYNYCNGSTLVQCTPSSVTNTVCANGCLNSACVNYAADCVNYDPDPAVPKTACKTSTLLVNCTNPNAPTYTDCAAAGQTCGTSYGSPACVSPPPPPPPACTTGVVCGGTCCPNPYGVSFCGGGSGTVCCDGVTCKTGCAC